MKKKLKKTKALIIVYVVLVITELFLCVPYNRIVVSLTKQNVLYSEIIGSGYSTIFDIQDDSAYLRLNYNGNCQESYGKRTDTPQLAVNLTVTTIVVSAIYFLFIFKKETDKEHIDEQIVKEILPYLDFNSLAFADEETTRKVQQEYAEVMYRYVKSQVNKK